MKRFPTLLRREIWEHKGGLVWTPIIVSLLLTTLIVVTSVVASMKIKDRMYEDSYTVTEEVVDENGEKKEVEVTHQVSGKGIRSGISKLENSSEEDRSKVMTGILLGAKLPVDTVLMFVLPFFCIAALFDERKDRSIHFWRSLPVSDTQAVLAKLSTAMFVAPGVVLAVVAVTQVIWLIGLTGVAWYFGLPAWSLIWAPSMLPLHWLQYAVGYVLTMLWILPFIGGAMLAAAVTRKPLLWLILPLPLAMLLEKLSFDTSYIAEWFGERVVGIFSLLVGDFSNIAVGKSASDLPPMFDHLSAASMFGNGQFWFGIALGAALIVLTIQARRRFQDV